MDSNLRFSKNTVIFNVLYYHDLIFWTFNLLSDNWLLTPPLTKNKKNWIIRKAHYMRLHGIVHKRWPQSGGRRFVHCGQRREILQMLTSKVFVAKT